MGTKVGVILEGMNIFLNKFGEQREKYLSNPGFFTRDRVLTFWQICWFIVNQSKRSLSIELDDHFSGQGLKSCSKGAFSKARYRINPVFFKDWHRHMVDLLYSRSKKTKTWRGYRLVGVDGSTLYLPSTQEMADEFGGNNGETDPPKTVQSDPPVTVHTDPPVTAQSDPPKEVRI